MRKGQLRKRESQSKLGFEKGAIEKEGITMSSSNNHNHGPYNLRPRSKVVMSVPPSIDHKNSPSRLEKSRIRKKIAEGTKLSFEEIEKPGARFLKMKGEELDKFLDAQLAGVVYIPPTPLSDEERDRIRDKHDLRMAETGLSYLNDPANGGAKYELVSPVASRFFLSDRGGIYHSNFEAKLENVPDAEVQLFFLEVVEKAPGKQKVAHCLSLGVSVSKAAATGLSGCRVCLKINHPKNVRFITC